MASVTRKPSSSRAERREVILAKLLAAVEQMLDDGESYTELSVERLVAQAGISRSTFYVYFEDKGALLKALLVDIMTREVIAAQAWWDLPPEAGRDQVTAGVRRVIEVYQPHELLMAAVVETATYDSDVGEVFERWMDNAISGLTKHIRTGQKAGHVRPGLDPAATAGWLTWMCERGCYTLVRGASPKQVERLADTLGELVWRTLYEGVRAA